MSSTRKKWFYSLTIENGAALSEPLRVTSGNPVGIFVPASWTTANITMQVSQDGVTWANAYDASGAEITLTVTAAGTYIVLPAGAFNAIEFVRFRSGTSGTPVNQSGARELVVALRPFE